MSANFNATLHKSGEIKFKGLALVEDEILLALKAHLRLDKGFSLRDLVSTFTRYPLLTAIDSRIADFVTQVQALPRARPGQLVLGYHQTLQLDSVGGQLDFKLLPELVLQDAHSGICHPVNVGQLDLIVDAPMLFGLAEIVHVTGRKGYTVAEAGTSVHVTVFDFLIGVLDGLFERSEELGVNVSASALDKELLKIVEGDAR